MSHARKGVGRKASWRGVLCCPASGKDCKSHLKIEIGFILFIVGLMVIIIVASENGSSWWVALGGAILSIGLDLFIDGKIDSAKKEIMEKLETIKNNDL